MLRLMIYKLSVIIVICCCVVRTSSSSLPSPSSSSNCPDGTSNCTTSNDIAITLKTEKSITLPKLPPNNSTEEPKGRALNFTIDENTSENILQSANRSKYDKFGDLSDVTINDDEDDEEEMINAKILSPKFSTHNSTNGICEKGGLTYENGEKLESGCDSICTCIDGKMDCTDRCKGPYFRRGKKIEDPLCTAKDTDDPCCSILVCTADTETEPLEICSYNNKTYNRGDKFYKGCDEVCRCEIAGKTTCKPRCPPINKTSDRCVEVQDPNDSCCKTILCDVTLDDHAEKDHHRLLSAKFINTTTVELNFDPKINENDEYNFIEASDDRQNWKTYQIRSGRFVDVHQTSKYLKIENSDDVIGIQEFNEKNPDGCFYNGKTLKLNEEYNDNCTSLCVCKTTGMECLKLECPTYFGVDVLDPNCIEWETVPPQFVPSPPACCPEDIRCKRNGSCIYAKQLFNNWQQIPTNITGCNKRCYCEMGIVECQNVCPAVTAAPPPELPCPRQDAIIAHLPDDDCCMYWVCKAPKDTTTPPATGPVFNYPGFQDEDITVHSLQAIDPHTVRLVFMVPTVIVGLHGRVEVRYTYQDDPDFNNWELQVFAPPNDLIATPQLEFDLLGLKSDTEYKIKITVTMRNLHNTPTSRIYKIRTPKDTNTTQTVPQMIPIEPDLSITDINSTWVTVNWRKFTEYELQFIDGLQLRYKEIDGMIYDATPLIHRSVRSFTLENLKSNTKYEIGIYFIPFPGQLTELHAKHMLHFTTANEIDTYGFNVTLNIEHTKSTSVEISWNGVPYPEDKYVNIYRAIYQSDSGKEDQSTFKIAKRDSPTRTVIMDLKPGTRYRLWLEVYLTNGKIKTSNVQEFVTKPRAAISLGAAAVSASSAQGKNIEKQGDYYGPLVIVAILASIAILSTLILLLILVRRHNQNKAAITPPNRVSQSAYDNPTYKVEIQQETMGL